VKIEKQIETTNPENSIIIPGKFFTILKNNIKPNNEIKINISENHISVEEENQTTITRIIKESFPDFNSVIPENLNQKATVQTEELIAAIKRVSIFSNKTTKQIIVNFNSNEITISTEDKETRSSAKEHVCCEYEGENITVAYNAQYIKEVLQNIDDAEVEIFFSGALTAAVFKPKTNKENTKTTALLMPLRTQQ
jgi:DNA polymerase-3 subunit beta